MLTKVPHRRRKSLDPAPRPARRVDFDELRNVFRPLGAGRAGLGEAGEPVGGLGGAPGLGELRETRRERGALAGVEQALEPRLSPGSAGPSAPSPIPARSAWRARAGWSSVLRAMGTNSEGTPSAISSW